MQTLNCMSVGLILLTAISVGQSRDPGAKNSNTNDPRQVLASAKTATIVSQIGEVAQTGRWMWDPNPEQLETHCRKRCRNGGVSRFLKKPITPIS